MVDIAPERKENENPFAWRVQGVGSVCGTIWVFSSKGGVEKRAWHVVVTKCVFPTKSERRKHALGSTRVLLGHR